MGVDNLLVFKCCHTPPKSYIALSFILTSRVEKILFIYNKIEWIYEIKYTSYPYITTYIHQKIRREGYDSTTKSGSYLRSRSFSCFFKSACSYRILSSLVSTMYISSLRWWILFSNHAMSAELLVTPFSIVLILSTGVVTCMCWGLANSTSMLNCCNRTKG